MASNIPRIVPATPDVTARIRVLGNPVFNRSGKACRYSSQEKNVSRSCSSVDFGAVAPGSSPAFSAASAAKSGRSGSGAALLPGFQPSGSSRGTHRVYSSAQVPSAITASSPEFRASISGWFSLATAQPTKLLRLKVFCTIDVGSPGAMAPSACCDGATHASIWPVFRFA